MPNWGSTSGVAARLTYKTIDANSNPTLTQLSTWLDEAEALLRTTLVAVDLPSTYSGDAAIVLGKWVNDYGEARIRLAWVAGDTAAQEDYEGAQALLESFNSRIEDIFNRPDRYGEMLGAGGVSSGAVHLRSYATYNNDSQTISDGHFAPTITREEQF